MLEDHSLAEHLHSAVESTLVNVAIMPYNVATAGAEKDYMQIKTTYRSSLIA